MFHRSFTHLHPSRFQVLMDFFDTSMFPVAQASDKGDHIQSTFSVRQGQSPFFFWTVGSLPLWALWISAPTNHQCHTIQARERQDLSVGMIRYPHLFSTFHTRCSLRL